MPWANCPKSIQSWAQVGPKSSSMPAQSMQRLPRGQEWIQRPAKVGCQPKVCPNGAKVGAISIYATNRSHLSLKRTQVGPKFPLHLFFIGPEGPDDERPGLMIEYLNQSNVSLVSCLREFAELLSAWPQSVVGEAP